MAFWHQLGTKPIGKRVLLLPEPRPGPPAEPKIICHPEAGNTKYIPLSPTGAELLFEVFSQRYERGSILVTTNLPFDEWTEVFGSERLTSALLDRFTHHVHILEMNGDSYRHSRQSVASQVLEEPPIYPMNCVEMSRWLPR